MPTRTQTRSRSRGRPSGSSKSARPASRVRTTTEFEDPNYLQPTPEPKSAVSLSPTWVEVYGTGRIMREPSTSYVRRSDLAEHTMNYPSGRGGVDIRPINNEPSVPWPKFRRANDQPYVPVSTYCGPPGTALDGSFQDPVASSNYRRAKAMASPKSSPMAETPPKRVIVSADYDSEDDYDEFSLRESPTWKKSRPDTPNSARFDSSGVKRAGGVFFDISQPFILILALLSILKGLTYLPREDTRHSAHQTICDRFGNPTGLNCKGDMNFTIENVVSHCHDAADRFATKLDMTSAKASIEDVWDSCKHVVSDASGKFGDVRVRAEEVKQALCKIPGSERLVDCAKTAVKKPRSKARKAFTAVGSVLSSPFISTTKSRKSSLPPLIPTIKRNSSKTFTRYLTSDHVEENLASSGKSAVSSVMSSVSSAFGSKVKGPEIVTDAGERFDSIMQSIMDSSPTQQATVHAFPNKYPDSILPKHGFSVPRGLEAIARVPDLQIRHDMAASKAEFKWLRSKDPTKVTKTTGGRTKKYSNQILNQLVYLHSDLDNFLSCVLRQSDLAVKELSKDISYGPLSESWKSFSLWHMGWTVTSVDVAFAALVNQPKQCRKILTRMDGRVSKLLQVRGWLLAEIEYYLEKTLEPDFGTRRYPWLPRLPTPRLPRPCFWPFKCKKKSRSQAEKDRAYRLLELREALRTVRNITDGLVEVKKLVDKGSHELKQAQQDIEKQKQRVLAEPRFGRAFLKIMLVDVKVARDVVRRVIKERKALRTDIYERVWGREAVNSTDVKARWISKELGL